MRNKTPREIKSLSDNSDPDEHDRLTDGARGSSPQACEGDLIDLTNKPNQKTMEPIQEDVERSSPDDTSPSKAKSSLVSTSPPCHGRSIESLTRRISTQASQVIGLIGRSISQRPQTVKTEQHVQGRRELQGNIRALQDTCARLRQERKDAVTKNRQLGCKLRKEEREHEATKAAAQQERERLESKLKSARAPNENTRRALEDAENEITRLRSEISSAKEDFDIAQNNALEDMSRLASEADIAKQELLDERNSARQNIAQLQNQIKLLNEKNDKFRQMLIPVSEKQVPDAEVVQRFTSLRSSMLALVRGTWKLAFRDDVDLISLSQDQIYIFKSGRTCDYDRLRYAVFYFIHKRILSTQHYFLENGLEETEQRLQLVEKELVERSPVGE